MNLSELKLRDFQPVGFFMIAGALFWMASYFAQIPDEHRLAVFTYWFAWFTILVGIISTIVTPLNLILNESDRFRKIIGREFLDWREPK